MDPAKIDQLIQYALAVAGREDEWLQRQLGPIHLLKYAYLGDLAHAEQNNGQTFTGAPWRFYHYGPWAAEVHDRIAPAVFAIGAQEHQQVNSKYDSDAIRWSLEDDEVLERLEGQVPLVVQSAIKKAVHSFGSDTTGLLHYVYKTRPMLRAVPNSDLDFRPAGTTQRVTAPANTVAVLTAKQQKKRKERVYAFRDAFQRKLQAAAVDADRVAPTPAPRYDDEFIAGVEWLDSLAGEEPSMGKGDVAVDDGVWSAPYRRDPDDP